MTWLFFSKKAGQFLSDVARLPLGEWCEQGEETMVIRVMMGTQHFS